ncbi:hypothetical protein GCM10010377_02020 [Streptomyces viridiviolaceus]|nr:hypothetical protein GCM10010377_02020 [Streptomyces viridiviolaceus]
MDVRARAMERGADVGADRSGAEYCDFHTRELRSVEGTEELPTLSTKYCLQYGGWVGKVLCKHRWLLVVVCSTVFSTGRRLPTVGDS